MTAATHRLKILHIDDEPMNVLVLEHLLRELGHCPTGVASAVEALDVKRRAKVTPDRRAKLTPLAPGVAVARRRSAEPLRSAARSRRAHPSRWI